MNNNDFEFNEVPLFNPSDALRAQLRSGYKNSDYAISEIIDNSIEANAKNISIFIVLGYVPPKKIGGHKSYNVRRIIILDDGDGIDPSILGNVLSFGFGTHINQTDSIVDGRGRLGKFGYGLPNSSVATANDIHVWSWKNGIASCLHTALNVPDILNGRAKRQTSVEKKYPNKDLIKMISATGSHLKDSGTIVEWNDTVRCTWAKISYLVSHVEETVGRIFRHFINDGSVKIQVFSFDEKDLESNSYFKPDSCRVLRVNDPLFLMKNSVIHEFLDHHDRNPDIAIFEPYELNYVEKNDRVYTWTEDGNTDVISVDIGGPQAALVKIRYSITTEFMRSNYGHGAAANKLVRANSGVSICRSGREISLSTAWIPSQDPTERWWGVEVDFPPALDDYFGVTNNKQTVPVLESYAKGEPNDYLETYRESIQDTSISSIEEAVDDMRNNDDPKWVSLLIKSLIYKRTRKMHRLIKKMKEGALTDPYNQPGVAPEETPDRSKEPGADDATRAIEGLKDNALNQTPKQTFTPEDYNKFTGDISDEQTKRDVIEWLNSSRKVRFQRSDLVVDDLFIVREEKGKTLITLNTSHPAYDKLFGSLNMLVDDQNSQEDFEKLTPAQVAARLNEVRNIIALLLYAMVSVEIQNYDEDKARILRSARHKYSEILIDLISSFNKLAKESGDTGESPMVFN